MKGNPYLSGILIVDKPVGMTSHQVVQVLRRLARQRRVGHGGTLDPLASGVLPLLLGYATRVAEYIPGIKKRYRAHIRLGASTDTYDAEGEISSSHPTDHLTREAVERALVSFQGEIQQLPPMHSALKHEGKPLYSWARAGVTVERRPRAVTIYRLDLVEWNNPELLVDLECSRGTYVRVLAHDLGHTPFGHSGEEALREAMADHGGFEHNQHGLRVVDVLERQYPAFRGLNLTYELREGIAKHTTRWDTPACEGFEPGPALLEAQAVEMADSIAYDNHDLDDGLEAGILAEEHLEGVSLWNEALQAAQKQHGSMDPQQRRRQAVRHLIDLLVTDVIENSRLELERRAIRRPEQARRQDGNLLGFSPAVEGRKKELEDHLHRVLYRHYRVVRVTNNARRLVKAIFRQLVADPRQLPPEQQGWAEEVGLERAVCDYLAGMTDRYAQDEYIQMFEPYPKL